VGVYLFKPPLFIYSFGLNMSLLLEYVDDLLNNSYQQPPSFYERHKGKIMGAIGVGLGAGAYHLLGHHKPVYTPPPEHIEPETSLHKIKTALTKGWDDYNRPVHPSEMTQGHRLSQISQLEQHKTMHGDSLTNQEYENLNRHIDELKKYSNR
jgi:hypothetical protein